jgi:hypothetical protein
MGPWSHHNSPHPFIPNNTSAVDLFVWDFEQEIREETELDLTTKSVIDLGSLCLLLLNSAAYFSNAKIFFQSFFMLTTFHPFAAAAFSEAPSGSA